MSVPPVLLKDTQSSPSHRLVEPWSATAVSWSGGVAGGAVDGGVPMSSVGAGVGSGVGSDVGSGVGSGLGTGFGAGAVGWVSPVQQISPG